MRSFGRLSPRRAKEQTTTVDFFFFFSAAVCDIKERGVSHVRLGYYSIGAVRGLVKHDAASILWFLGRFLLTYIGMWGCFDEVMMELNCHLY